MCKPLNLVQCKAQALYILLKHTAEAIAALAAAQHVASASAGQVPWDTRFAGAAI
jgi:hypothetical protein